MSSTSEATGNFISNPGFDWVFFAKKEKCNVKGSFPSYPQKSWYNMSVHLLLISQMKMLKYPNRDHRQGLLYYFAVALKKVSGFRGHEILPFSIMFCPRLNENTLKNSSTKCEMENPV